MIKTALLLVSIGGLATTAAPKTPKKVQDCQDIASKWEASNAKEGYVPIGTQPLGDVAFGMFMGKPETRDVRALFFIMKPDEFNIDKGVSTLKSGTCQMPNGGPKIQWKVLHKDPMKV